MGRKSQRLITTIFRMIACIPPLLLSLVLKDFSKSIQMAGFAGLYVAFLAPALLQWKSHAAYRNTMGENNTCNTGWYSGAVNTIPVFVFTAFSLLVLIYPILQKAIAW